MAKMEDILKDKKKYKSPFRAKKLAEERTAKHIVKKAFGGVVEEPEMETLPEQEDLRAPEAIEDEGKDDHMPFAQALEEKRKKPSPKINFADLLKRKRS